jgi:hypothetical protein
MRCARVRIQPRRAVVLHLLHAAWRRRGGGGALRPATMSECHPSGTVSMRLHQLFFQFSPVLDSVPIWALHVRCAGCLSSQTTYGRTVSNGGGVLGHHNVILRSGCTNDRFYP